MHRTIIKVYFLLRRSFNGLDLECKVPSDWQQVYTELTVW